MSNGLTLRDSLAPTNFDQLTRFADMVSNTGMVPTSYRGKPAEIVAAVIYGSDLGLTPMQSLQSVAVVNGKPSVYGDALRALVLSKPDCEGIEDGYGGEGDDYYAWVTVHRKGKKPVTRRFSVGDARKAQLLDKQGPWKQYRDRMLLMRANGFAIRDAYADALRGVISYEEASDYPTGPEHAKDVTPKSDAWGHPATTTKPARSPSSPQNDGLVTIADKDGEFMQVSKSEVGAEWAKLVRECGTVDELMALATANDASKSSEMKAKLGDACLKAWKARRDEIRAKSAKNTPPAEPAPIPKSVDDLVTELGYAPNAEIAEKVLRRDDYARAVSSLTPADAVRVVNALVSIDDTRDWKPEIDSVREGNA